MHATLRVLIALEEAALRERIRAVVAQSATLVVVGEVDNGQDALVALERLTPEVVILGCQLPDMPGADVVAEAQRRHPATRAVAIGAEAGGCLQAMLRAGATGYIVAGKDLQIVPLAIETATWGGPHVNLWGADSFALVPSGSEPNADDPPAERLTNRQLWVAYLISQGYSNKQIALTLHFSLSTIESEVRHTKQALGVTSRLDVAKWARRNIPARGPAQENQG